MRNLLNFWRSNRHQHNNSGNNHQINNQSHGSSVTYEPSSTNHGGGKRRKSSHVHLGREFEGTQEERCGLTSDIAGNAREDFCGVDMDPKAHCDGDYNNTGDSAGVSLSRSKPNTMNNKARSVLDGFFNPRKRGEQTRRPRRVFIMMVAGLIGIGCGLFILLVHPYDLIYRMKSVLSDGSEGFTLWRDPPVGLTVKVYIFNVTNAEAFMRGEEKMQIEEVGPYVFLESPYHSNVTFNENGTMSTIPKHPLKSVPGGRSEDDILMVPNIALLSITQSNVDASYFTRLGLNMLVRQTGSEPLVRMTAREFMFGYKTPLVTLGNNLLPRWIKFDKLGLIDRMYDFEGDYETVYTGELDASQSGLLASYRGSRYLPHWPGGEGKCADVEGASDGTKYAGYVESRQQRQKFFRKSMCRPADLVHIRDETVRGLDSYVYSFADDAFDNGHRNEEHKCYCRNGRCLQDGMIDVTDCYYGFPIALSYPHFYKGDPALQDYVDGGKPDPELHRTEIHVEPGTGLPVKVAVRLQINMVFTDLSSMAKVGRFSNMVLPMLWFEIGMPGLPEYVNNKFIFYLNIAPVLERVLMYGGFIIGSAVLIASIVKVMLTVPYRGRSISDNLKRQYNLKPHQTGGNWLQDQENGKDDKKHIQGFIKHQKNSTNLPNNLGAISEKYLGATSGSIYNPCEENFPGTESTNQEADSLIDIPACTTNNTKDTQNGNSDTWLNRSLGNFLDRAKPYFSAENIHEHEGMKAAEQRGRKFSENRGFICNELILDSEGTLRYGDVSDNLSDLERRSDGSSDKNDDDESGDPYEYSKVPSASNSDNEQEEAGETNANHSIV